MRHLRSYIVLGAVFSILSCSVFADQLAADASAAVAPQGIQPAQLVQANPSPNADAAAATVNAAATNVPPDKLDQAIKNSPQNLLTAPSNLPFKPTSDNLQSLGFKPLEGSAPAIAQPDSTGVAQPIVPAQPQPAPNLPALSNSVVTAAASQSAVDELYAGQQQLQQRIATLESSGISLQKQISILGQYVIGLDEQLGKLKLQLQKLEQPPVTPQLQANGVEPKSSLGFASYLRYQLTNKGWIQALLVAIAVGILLFLWDIFYRKRNRNILSSVTKADEEYDFLSGEEGIAARLNLARAYVEMGNKQSAEQILREVLVRGNEIQKAEAKKLLEKIIPVGSA